MIFFFEVYVFELTTQYELDQIQIINSDIIRHRIRIILTYRHFHKLGYILVYYILIRTMNLNNCIDLVLYICLHSCNHIRK
jgi:hypothetical protein